MYTQSLAPVVNPVAPAEVSPPTVAKPAFSDYWQKGQFVGMAAAVAAELLPLAKDFKTNKDRNKLGELLSLVQSNAKTLDESFGKLVSAGPSAIEKSASISAILSVRGSEYILNGESALSHRFLGDDLGRCWGFDAASCCHRARAVTDPVAQRAGEAIGTALDDLAFKGRRALEQITKSNEYKLAVINPSSLTADTKLDPALIFEALSPGTRTSLLELVKNPGGSPQTKNYTTLLASSSVDSKEVLLALRYLTLQGSTTALRLFCEANPSPLDVAHFCGAIIGNPGISPEFKSCCASALVTKVPTFLLASFGEVAVRTFLSSDESYQTARLLLESVIAPTAPIQLTKEDVSALAKIVVARQSADDVSLLRGLARANPALLDSLVAHEAYGDSRRILPSAGRTILQAIRGARDLVASVAHF